jgi:hypothetical protein
MPSRSRSIGRSKRWPQRGTQKERSSAYDQCH